MTIITNNTKTIQNIETIAKPAKEPIKNIVWAIFVILAFIWGTSFILMKEALRVFSSEQVAALRMAAAWVVVIGMAVFHIRKVPKSKLKFLFLSGMLGSFIPAFLFTAAQIHIDSSSSGILNSLTPCFTFVVGALFFQQKTSLMKFFGLLLGFLGCVILITINQKGEVSLNAYALLVVLATVLYGFNINITKRYLSDINPVHIATVSIAMIGTLAIIFLFSFTDFVTRLTTIENSANALGYAVILGVFGTGVSSILFYKMLQMSSPIFASSVTYFVPIVAVCWGMYAGETLHLAHFVGMSVIILGVVIVNKAA